MKQYLFFLLILSILGSCKTNTSQQEMTVKSVIDDLVTQFYDELSPAQMDTLSEQYILSQLTDEEKEVLATKYWYFDVNVPVTVSVMHSVEQPSVPFWLKSGNFQKTDWVVKNENYTYNVWQKDFEAGKVELGVNGFDMHRTVYFISVGAKNAGDELEITNNYPEKQHFENFDIGAFTYHDWDELVIEEMPEELKGHTLFTTWRGRAREAHLLRAFRDTEHPSSETPDQLMLTWSGDTKSTIDIQWRTSVSVSQQQAKYWIEGSSDTLTAQPERYEMEDRLLRNDRYINRYTAHLSGLQPGTKYNYMVGAGDLWSEQRSFETAAEDEEFSFIWFGDTHYSPLFGEIANEAFGKHPEAAFYTIAGDQVSTGLYRNQWDDLFDYTKDIISCRPFMNVLGNHDHQDGLGAWMYEELFSNPKNGPAQIAPEHSYTFTYKNAFFLMIDACSPMKEQTEWIEQQLAATDATWKFAFFHFPPYNWEEPYYDIQAEWVPIFDKYHVNMVSGGHIHYYMRSKPMKGGEVVDSYNEGTAYMISVGIPSNHHDIGEEPYAAVRNTEGWQYQLVTIKGKTFKFESFNRQGELVDEFGIEK